MVAVGTHKGFVQIWDAAAGKKLSMLEGHTARVGEDPPAQPRSWVTALDQASPNLLPLCRGAGLEC